MNIKKAFQPIIDLLEANKGAKVSDIFEEAVTLTSAKVGGGGRASSTVHRVGEVVTHIFCYYHKRWEAVETAEYGKKASSPTGFSNMCKEGTSAWTKQQRDAKNAKDALLTGVQDGTIKPGELKAKMEAIETARSLVVARADKHGTTKEPVEAPAKS